MKIQLSKAVGVLVCLAGAFLMVWGNPILGENHASIATIVGIMGIGIIASSNAHARKRRRMIP